MKRVRVLFRILFIVYICMVFFFCLYSFKDTGVDLSKYIFGIRGDRIAHFIMFFPYPFSAWLASKKELREKFGKASHLVLFISGVSLAITVELLQSLNTNRESDPMDVLANLSGLLVATAIILILEKFIDNVWPDRLQ
ncbi:MAG: VanZ family protein [Bacteroidales bacterium]|nr:VanZ family protein [Bacteroidales bacterium]